MESVYHLFILDSIILFYFFYLFNSYGIYKINLRKSSKKEIVPGFLEISLGSAFDRSSAPLCIRMVQNLEMFLDEKEKIFCLSSEIKFYINTSG